jgi:hypothetical protein
LYSCKKDEPTPLPEERQLVEEARLALKTQAERDFFDFDYLEDNHALILPEGKLEYRDAQDEAFVQQVMDKILLQNAAEGFVTELISRIGYPAWSRSEVSLENSNMHRVAFIPFIKPGENKISAYLMAFKPGEAWWFRLIEKERLKQALIHNEPSIAENSKTFYSLYDLSFDIALFDTADSLIQEWFWDHIDTDELTGQDNNIDFRCTTYPVETGRCIIPYSLHDDDDAIEERTFDCPGNLIFIVVNEYIVYGADCWNSNGYQYFPGGEDWYGNPGGLGTVPITYNNHPYLLPIMILCNEIDQVQSGEVVNGQTYSQSDIDRCNQIQQIIYYTMISPNDLAWLLSNNTEAFTDIATYVSNGDRTPLQLQGVSAYIRLLVQGRVNIPLREFMPKYQIVFGELVPVLGLTEEEAEYLMISDEEIASDISQFLENEIDGEQVLETLFQGLREGHFPVENLGEIINSMLLVHKKKDWPQVENNRLETLNQIENIRQYLSRRKTDYGEAAQYLENLLEHLQHQDEFTNEEVYRVYELSYDWYADCAYNTLSSIVKNIVNAVRPFIEMALIESGFQILGNLIAIRAQASFRLTSELPASIQNSSAQVWSRISSTAPNVPNTTIPNTFTFTAQNGQHFYVQFSATEHFGELVVKGGASLQPWFQAQKGLRSQLVLDDFAKAVDEIVSNGTVTPLTNYQTGRWIIIFGDVTTYSNGNMRIFHIQAW